MSFNINNVINDMVSVMKNSVESDAEDISGYAQQVLQGEKETLQELAELRLNGQITDEELKSELQDEKDTVEAQMLALVVMNKAMIQKAANAAMDVLFKAVKTALG